MDPLVLLMGSFFVLIALRVEIAFSLALASLITIIYIDLPLASVVNQMYAGINSFPLMAVPFFMFLGRLLNDGGITERLLDVADATVGHIRGGLGHINVFVSMIFASLSGSASADTASVGSILIPAMKQAGYDPAYTVAITAASSTLGVIIPPSIIMIIYGAFGEVSIGALFFAGVVPGVMIGLGMMIYTYILAIRHGYPANPRKPLRDMARALWRGAPPLLIPVLVLGGVTGGLFTPTEASIIAVVYAMFLAFVVYRIVGPARLPAMLSETVISFSAPMFLVASAGIFGWLISYLGAADRVANFITGVTTDPFGIMMMLIGFLLLVGTFLNPISAVLIFLPIIQALGELGGTHPVQLGVIVVMSLAVGLITPPYGICLLIAAQIGEVSTGRAFAAVIPLVLIVLAIILLALLFPDLVLYLPRTMLPNIFPGG